MKWFMCRSSAPIPAEKHTKTHLVGMRLHILYAFTFDTIDFLFDVITFKITERNHY